MMIQLYIYKKADGSFLYEDTGSLEGILLDLGQDKDFTLKPYPSGTGHAYRWIDNNWIKEGDIEKHK